MNQVLIPDKLWVIDQYFEPQRFQQIKSLYRESRMPLSMQYDNRVLSDWSHSAELQQVAREQTDRISELIQQKLNPQVAYVSLDLSGAHIMMHRLHPDIFIQCQIVMSDAPAAGMEFAVCIDQNINQNSKTDYEPAEKITESCVETIAYCPNTASVYVNHPRRFVGMLNPIPANTVREVLVLSYTRLY